MSALSSFEWARALSRDPSNGLTWKAIAVARTLADHAKDDVCTLLQATIAAEARISERAVRDGLAELRKLGVLGARRTRGASVFVLQCGTTRRTETGTTCRTQPPVRHDTPVRPAPGADRRTVSKENQEVTLSEGSNENADASRAEQDRHHLEVITGNGNGTGGPTPQPALLASAQPPAEVRQLARRIFMILDGGFAGLTEPKPEWRRPTAYAVEQALERNGRPGPIVAEHAAKEARRTLQQREDGRNVVGLFEHKLRTELGKQVGIHAKLVAELGRPMESGVAG